MRGPVFAQARTAAGFEKVAIDPETGTVVWPEGADLAPDTLYPAYGPARGRTKTSPPRARPPAALRPALSREVGVATEMLLTKAEHVADDGAVRCRMGESISGSATVATRG
jgi:hypothetical protein